MKEDPMRYPIMMGDVVGSMRARSEEVYQSLGDLIKRYNRHHRAHIRSPMTITLGDEFQGVTDTFQSAVASVFWLDEQSRLLPALPLKLKFSVVYGEISTPINEERAHEMIGEGLKLARALVSSKKRGHPRVNIRTDNDKLDRRFENIITAVDGIIARWNEKDFPFIDALIHETSDAVMGEKVNKTRQQIYKRRQTLLIREYVSLKNLAIDMARDVP